MEESKGKGDTNSGRDGVSAQPIQPAWPRHPDIFDDETAAAYLGLPGPSSMNTIAKNYSICSLDLPGPRKWHREDLDTVVREARGTGKRRNITRGLGKDHRLTLEHERRKGRS